MIEKYLDWLETKSLLIEFFGLMIPCFLFITIVILISVVLGIMFGWFTTDISTHLNGQCEQFYQYILVGKQLVLEAVNVCP